MTDKAKEGLQHAGHSAKESMTTGTHMGKESGQQVRNLDGRIREYTVGEQQKLKQQQQTRKHDVCSFG